jgi:hypothetical protein
VLLVFAGEEGGHLRLACEFPSPTLFFMYMLGHLRVSRLGLCLHCCRTVALDVLVLNLHLGNREWLLVFYL